MWMIHIVEENEIFAVPRKLISTKLGTHIAICMCRNLMYILYIFCREDGVGGREFG
jgi:hypothetical protein